MSSLAYDFGLELMMQQAASYLNLLRLRDQYTGDHSGRMKQLARELCLHFNLSHEETQTIEVASYLHDLGKIGVPDPILRKPGPLTPEEREVMNGHPLAGWLALREMGEFRDVSEIILHHHEWYDGRGYPDGLAGEAIPFGARIVAVLDAYDALISDRPYRRARPIAVAIEELVQGKGTQFDPDVVDALLHVVKVRVH